MAERFRLLQVEQRTDEWYKLHNPNKNDFYISASVVAAVCGYGFCSAVELSRQYLGVKKPAPDNVFMKWGRDKEEEAKQAFAIDFAADNFQMCDVGSVFSPRWKWLSASLDSLLYSEDLQTLVNLEIKCPAPTVRNNYEPMAPHEAPIKYVIQMYVQMHCLQLDQSILYYWTPAEENRQAFLITEFDMTFWYMIMTRVLRFKSTVQRGELFDERPDRAIKEYYARHVAPFIVKLSSH